MRFPIYLAAFATGCSLPAGAQTMRDAQRAGINVVGRATVRVPADGICFEANVAGYLSGADEQSILAQLRAGGVESPQIADSNVVTANGFSVVRGILRRPTRERVEALGKLATSILAAHPGLRIQNAVAATFLDDCAKAEEQARRQALDDARRRALAIAAAENVSLGSLAGVSEIPSTACAPNEGRFLGPATPNAIERDPAVYVSETEDVTFALAP